MRKEAQRGVDEPRIVRMASGNLSLLITDDVTWESFPAQAVQFLRRCKGRVLRKIDSPVERLWIVLIRWRPFWLSYEDHPPGLSLDSMNRLCNPVVQELHRLLSGKHGGPP